MQEHQEIWSGGIEVTVRSEDNEHTGHNVNHYETLHDNPIEVCVWYWCRNCDKAFRHHDVTWDNAPM